MSSTERTQKERSQHTNDQKKIEREALKMRMRKLRSKKVDNITNENMDMSAPVEVQAHAGPGEVDQLAMEEADFYNDNSWDAFDYYEEESEGEGEGVDPENQELEAEGDSHRPYTPRCVMVSTQSHKCPVTVFHTSICKYFV